MNLAPNILDTDSAIRERRTSKVLAQDPLPQNPIPDLAELLALAGMAPFHRACDESHRAGDQKGIEPWRFYIAEEAACRSLREKVHSIEGAGKIPAMLASARALIIVTWLPNPSQQESVDGAQLFEPTLGNMEHIAAASAAIQNLLLAATARGIPNYWSSGGVLRSQAVFEMLGVPQQQILLGAVFLFPEQSEGLPAETVYSKLRASRGNTESWSRALPE